MQENNTGNQGGGNQSGNQSSSQSGQGSQQGGGSGQQSGLGHIDINRGTNPNSVSERKSLTEKRSKQGE